MSLQSGPVNESNPISADNLEKGHPVAFNILRELARLNDPTQKTYATILAQNLVYELRKEEDSPNPEELDVLAGYLVQLRFKNGVGLNPTLVLQKSEFFSRIFLNELFNAADFIIDTSDPDEAASLRQWLFDTAKSDNSEKAVNGVKRLFVAGFNKPRIIATLLPFYHDFLKLAGESTDSDVKKKAFTELIASAFIEDSLVTEIAEIGEEEDPEELENLKKILVDLRENHGLYDSFIAQLDKALPLYKSPVFSAETLSILEKQYKASQNYLNFEKNTQQLIADWDSYINTFDVHSPCRKIFSDLVEDLEEECEHIAEKLTEDYRDAEGVSQLVTSTKKMFAELVAPYQKLKELLDPFRERSQQLAKVFKQIAQDFPPNSDYYRGYQDLSINVLDVLGDLEKQIDRNNPGADNHSHYIADANVRLTKLIERELNFVVAGLTPLQRIADQLGKTFDLEKRNKLETSLLRLQLEGADASITTPQYRGRASTTVLKDAAINLVTLRNPFQPRSRNAREIAAMHSASSKIIEKLMPRSAKDPNSSWGFSPKNLLNRAGFYLGIHRVSDLVSKFSFSLGFGKSQPTPTSPAMSQSELLALETMLLMPHGGLPNSPIYETATERQPAGVNFGKGPRYISPAPTSLSSTQSENKRRSLVVS